MSINSIEFNNLEQSLIKAFQNLNISFLNILDETAYYSHNYKHEFIAEMQTLFEKFNARGLTSLIAKPSKCIYCYPTGKAYSFHNPDNDEFIIRYVIFQESEKVFCVQECRNKPIPEGEDGMPF
jgi:hypothetical protein